MEQSLDIELAVAQLQADVAQLDIDVDRLERQVQGGDDPTRGLLVLVADLTKTVGSLTSLVADLQKEQRTHMLTVHPVVIAQPQWGWLSDIGKSIAASVSVVMVLAIIGWAVLGLRVTLTSPIGK